MNPSETETREATCEECGGRFTYEHWIFDETCCPSCAPARDARLEAEAEIHRAEKAKRDHEEFLVKSHERWLDLVPDRYTSTDVEHAEFRRGLNEKISGWKPSPEKPFLGLVGLKGCCKTRIAALRLRRAMCEADGIYGRDYDTSMYGSIPSQRRPLFLASYDFSRSVSEQYSKDKDEAKEAKQILRNATHASWLIFDDIGKAKATPAVVAALFALVDHRHAHNSRTIWTANSTPEEFCEGMPADVAGPLVRRLKEASTLYAIQ